MYLAHSFCDQLAHDWQGDQGHARYLHLQGKSPVPTERVNQPRPALPATTGNQPHSISWSASGLTTWGPVRWLEMLEYENS